MVLKWFCFKTQILHRMAMWLMQHYKIFTNAITQQDDFENYWQCCYIFSWIWGWENTSKPLTFSSSFPLVPFFISVVNHRLALHFQDITSNSCKSHGWLCKMESILKLERGIWYKAHPQTWQGTSRNSIMRRSIWDIVYLNVFPCPYTSEFVLNCTMLNTSGQKYVFWINQMRSENDFQNT